MFRQEYAGLSIFEGLDPRQVNLLSPFMEEIHFKQDEIIFEQGQLADCLYILLTGEVLVRFKPYDGPPLTVAKITPGGVFGWSSALGRDSYTSGALAEVDCAAYRIRHENLRRLCEAEPETANILLDRLAGVIAERLRNTHNSILDMLNHGIETNGNGDKKKEAK